MSTRAARVYPWTGAVAFMFPDRVRRARQVKRARRATSVVLIGAGLAAVAGTGVAYAYYRAAVSGSQTGTAATGNATFTMTVTGKSTTALQPNTTGTVTLQLVNPFNKAITITGVTPSVTTSNETNCPGATNFIAPSSPTGLPASIAANGTVTPTLSNAVTMKQTAATLCQGVTVTYTLTVSGKLP